MFTQSQINKFHKEGIIVAKNLIQGRELNILQEISGKVVHEGMDYSNSKKFHLYKNQEDGSKTYYRSERMWDRDPIFQAVTVNPDIIKCLSQLIGHPFMPFNDSFVVKIPKKGVPVEWHQDPPYKQSKWLRTHSIPNIDVDIYLDHSTKDNGCLWGIPNHHLVGHVEINNFTEEQLFNHPNAIAYEMEPGDVSFHSLSAPHGSKVNKTNDFRRTFYIHYLNKIVYEECYKDDPNFSSLKDERDLFFMDFDLNAKNKINNMISLRKSFNFPDAEKSDIELTEEGFQFIGSPKTTPFHWDTLYKQLSSKEIFERKKLNVLA